MATSGRLWQEVGDRVFSRRYPYLDQQIGVVLGDGEVLVVDTRSTPSHAGEVLADLRALTADPVTIVVDTHWHWDHAFGNATFRPARIWGHVRTRDRLLAEGQARRDALIGRVPEIAGELPSVEIDPPDRVLETSATITVGGRVVELRHLGRGHTDADVVVSVPDADVLFAGDLLEEGATPSFGDAYPLDWPSTVDRLMPLATGRVVPGHGSVGDRAFVVEQLEGLRAVADLAREVHAGVASLDEARRRGPWDVSADPRPLERGLAQLRGEFD